MALSILVTVSSADTAPILDATDRAYGLTFGTNEHGFSALEFSYPLGANDAFSIYDRMGAAYIRVSDNGTIVWEGRVEDVAITDYGLRIKAFGFQRALSDVRYTGAFSQSETTDWKTILESDISGRNPKMFEFDTQGRLFTGISKGAVYQSGGGSDAFSFYLPQPSQSSLDWIGLDFTYELYAPTNWRAAAIGYNNGWANVVALGWTLDAAGSVQTATCALTFSGSARDIVVFSFFNNTGSASSPAGENGAYYLKLTGVRAKGTTSAALYADEIADALVAYVNGLNSTQLNSSTILVESPGVDLAQEVYEDQAPADILSRLARIGDTSGNVWEWGVYEGQRLHFRARGSAGREWYVDSSSLSIEKTIDTLANSVYAVYSEASGRALRTATSSSTYSQSRSGVVRQAAVAANTTGSASAVYVRDTALTDGADPSPRISIAFREVYGADGARWKLWNVRSGDTITIRNLPPTISVDIDRIRTFRVSETTYRADDDALEVIPETPPPMLDVLVARRAAGVS